MWMQGWMEGGETKNRSDPITCVHMSVRSEDDGIHCNIDSRYSTSIRS